jgi:hypothetical protein
VFDQQREIPVHGVAAGSRRRSFNTVPQISDGRQRTQEIVHPERDASYRAESARRRRMFARTEPSTNDGIDAISTNKHVAAFGPPVP